MGAGLDSDAVVDDDDEAVVAAASAAAAAALSFSSRFFLADFVSRTTLWRLPVT